MTVDEMLSHLHDIHDQISIDRDVKNYGELLTEAYNIYTFLAQDLEVPYILETLSSSGEMTEETYRFLYGI